MQSPVLIFDHIAKTAMAVPTGPAGDKKLAELAAAQRDLVATSGRPRG